MNVTKTQRELLRVEENEKNLVKRWNIEERVSGGQEGNREGGGR